jgi:hypothetical protein
MVLCVDIKNKKKIIKIYFDTFSIENTPALNY